MNEKRDPITCPDCDTVNPYMNQACRRCGRSLEGVPAGLRESEPPPPPEGMGIDNPSHTPRASSPAPWNPQRLNAMWMIIGTGLYAMIVTIGQVLIINHMVLSDPQRAAVYERAERLGGEIPESEKEDNLSLFMPVISVAAVVFLITPFIVGAVVGYFTRRRREASITVGVATVLIFVMQGGDGPMILIGLLIALALNVGVGFAGAIVGNLLHRRFGNGGNG